MHFVDIEKVVVPANRQRREFDPRKITELSDSIRHIGLMHPIVVQNDGITLVAGERRLRAIKNLHFLGQGFSCAGSPVFDGQIPAVKLAELSPTQVYEAELAENTIRADLSWQEKAEAVLRLQELRSLQTGVPVSSKEIAEEINGSNDTGYQDQLVRRQLIVAKHLDNPEVAKAKNVDEAMKILKTREKQKENAAIGATLPPEILKSKHRLIIGKFQDADLPEGNFTCTITDPPYGIGAETFGGSGSNAMGALAGHTYSDSPEEWKSLMYDLGATLWDVGAPNSHHYVFCDFEKFVELRSIFSGIGFRVFRTPFVMCKTSSVRAPWQEQGPWKSTEYILYAIKGSKACKVSRTDFIVCRGDENLGHGAQKPVSLYTDLLERSAGAGDSVLDLCCGTGTIFPAAHALKCIATGVELIPQNAAIAAKRLEELT
jgi:hypothetical protein